MDTVLSMNEQANELRDGNIVGLECQECKYQQLSPMLGCPKCHSRDIVKATFSSNGKVVSYTIQTVASEQYLNETPFAFAIIQLDGGPKVSGWIPWIAKPADLPLGQAVLFSPSYKGGMQFEKS